MTVGYNKELYIRRFDHRGSFETKMFGWHGALDEAQTAEIAAAATANSSATSKKVGGARGEDDRTDGGRGQWPQGIQ